MKTTKGKIWRNTFKSLGTKILDWFENNIFKILKVFGCYFSVVLVISVPFFISKIFVSGSVGENSILFLQHLFPPEMDINIACGIIAVVGSILLFLIIVSIYFVIKKVKETYKEEKENLNGRE